MAKGQRDAKFTESIGSISVNVESEVEDLCNEMVDWRDNLDGNEMSHLPKYDEVSECADAMEQVQEAAVEIREAVSRLPEGTQRAEVTFIQDTRKKASSRSGRLHNIVLMVVALRSKVEDLGMSLSSEDDLSDEDVEVLENLRSVEDACDLFEGETDNVTFPGMY